MKLNDGDSVVSARVLEEGASYITSVSKLGYIKSSPLTEVRLTGRATKGKRIQKVDDLLVDFLFTKANEDFLVVSSTSQLRINTNDVPIFSLGTQGVKAIKLPNFSLVVKLNSI